MRIKNSVTHTRTLACTNMSTRQCRCQRWQVMIVHSSTVTQVISQPSEIDVYIRHLLGRDVLTSYFFFTSWFEWRCRQTRVEILSQSQRLRILTCLLERKLDLICIGYWISPVRVIFRDVVVNNRYICLFIFCLFVCLFVLHRSRITRSRRGRQGRKRRKRGREVKRVEYLILKIRNDIQLHSGRQCFQRTTTDIPSSSFPRGHV